MWVLQNNRDCDIRFYLIEGQEYTVGRRDCRILILNDNSVSRNHAKLTVTHSDANLSKPLERPLLTFHESSKFGSLRNGAKLGSGDTSLEDGDLITFGAMNSNEWRVTYEPLVVAFSSLPSVEKKSLKLLTRKLGGHVVPEWSKECTHLIMTQLTVTIKVIGALVTCRHIVTPEFLRKTEEAAAADSKMPDPLNYHPTLAETAINEKDVSFQPNVDRQTLFNGMTVVFLTAKQLKQLGQIVELAGGKPVLIDEGMSRGEEKVLTDPSTIVMYADPQDQSQIMTQAGQEWATQVMDVLKRRDLRPIPQSELGLAVLYASTEVHCNPRVAQAGLTFLHPVAAPSLTQDVLASETQHSKLPQSQVPETRKTSSVARQQQEKTKITGPEKSSKKRVREEDNSNISAPSKLPRREPVSLPNPDQAPSTSILDVIMKNAAPVSSKQADSSKQASSLQKLRNSSSARISTQKRSPEGIVKADAANPLKKGHLGSGSDGDILSPSERIDKTKSRNPERNPNPCTSEKDYVTVEDSDDEADAKTLEDDVIPPSGRPDEKDVILPTGRRDEKMVRGRNKDIHHLGLESQLVKKDREVTRADSDGDIIPPKRETNDKTTNKDMNDHKSVSQAFEPKAMDAKIAPSEGGTITKDVLPPTGNENRGRRTGKRPRDDAVAMDIEDASQKRDVTEEGGGMNKSKKSRLAEEDYKGSNPTIDQEPISHDANPPLQEIPTGYITANKNIKCEPSSPSDPTLPFNLAIVEQIDLVIRIATAPPTRQKTNAKNFKKFKKASYVGQFSMPHIIGGSDLYHSETRQLAEARAEMAKERKVLEKEKEQKALDDDLFNWEPRPTKRRR
ncbi:nibrin-like [Asterias amurensis]|uniref:nibrin-like n=1 Tax=Asterias amurensis TaxID=7602 RepID=UPI003AB82DA5